MQFSALDTLNILEKKKNIKLDYWVEMTQVCCNYTSSEIKLCVQIKSQLQRAGARGHILPLGKFLGQQASHHHFTHWRDLPPS